MEGNRMVKPFGIRDKIGYMMGDFGCNMSFQLISSYLMLFMTQGMGLSPADWAGIVIIAKIFDAINDPIIGALVDSRKPSKSGKFKPWILYGSFAIAVTTTLLFVDIRAFSYAGKYAYCLIMYMIWSVAYTAANVPYGSLNAVLTDDPGERASLSSLRSIGAGIAMLPIMVAMPLIVYGEKDNNGFAPVKPDVFVWVALVAGIIGIVGFMMTYFMTTERSKVPHRTEKFNYMKTLTSFFKNRAILALCIASFAQLVFIVTYSITLPLVFQFYFEDAKLIAVASILTMLPMMIFIPFMSKLSVKYGKKEIATLPNLLSIVVLVIMLFVKFPRSTTGGYMYMVMLMIAMLGGGTFMLATWSMVADAVDYQEIQSGKREEASVYATYSLARKIAQGVGAGLISLLLGFVGYTTESGSVGNNMSESVAGGILRLSIIMPLIGYVIVFLVLAFMYNLSKKKVEENTLLLRAKHGDINVDTSPTKLFDEKFMTSLAMGVENIENIESGDTFVSPDTGCNGIADDYDGN